MASQGPLSPGTLANDTAVGTTSWTDPGNAASSNNAYAAAGTSSGETTNYLKATNFGFTIPAGATIDGIIVEIERKCITTSGSPRDNIVRLVIGGTVSGNNKASVSTWPTSDAYATYGGAADIWGLAPTDSDVNGSTFGVVLSAKCDFTKGGSTWRVDHIRITVHYTEGGGGGGGQPAVKRMGGVKFAHGGYQDGSGIMRWRHSQAGIWLPNNRTIIQPENRIAV